MDCRRKCPWSDATEEGVVGIAVAVVVMASSASVLAAMGMVVLGRMWRTIDGPFGK